MLRYLSTRYFSGGAGAASSYTPSISISIGSYDIRRLSIVLSAQDVPLSSQPLLSSLTAANFMRAISHRNGASKMNNAGGGDVQRGGPTEKELNLNHSN